MPKHEPDGLLLKPLLEYQDIIWSFLFR